MGEIDLSMTPNEKKPKRNRHLFGEDTDREIMKFVRSFGELVRRARRQARITQEELAERSGVDRSHISDIERGVNAPSLVMLYKLARGLGLTPGTLICGEERDIDRYNP